MTTTEHHDLSNVLVLVHQVARGATDLTDADLADAVVLTQDAIAQLRKVELDLAAALGARTGPTTGNVSDGRQFTLRRVPDRKDWDHNSWHHDVRRVITERIGARFTTFDDKRELIDCESSEVVTLGAVIQQALTEAQRVHGSTAPRSTDLRKLGLYANDYCTSSPGGWRLSAIRADLTHEGAQS